MSRLWIFLFGALVGAVGVFYLFDQGYLDPGNPPGHGRSQGRVAGAPGGYAQPAWPAPTAIAPPPILAPTPPGPEAITPAPVAMAPVALPEAALAEALAPIAATGLLIPVVGVQAGQLTDTYTQSRGEGRTHEAIDIMAARGTPVVAAADGKVVKLFTSKRGGLTVYEFDREEKLAYYYAHLDSYAPGVLEGKVLKRGDLVGYVGSTGDASPDAPHLHFAIFVLGPEKSWWKGTAINPYSLLGGRAAGTQAVGERTHAGPARN